MKKQEYNYDFKKGITFLLKESRKRHFNVKQSSWVVPFSLLLSEENNCFNFWRGVIEQDRLEHIPSCHSVYDVCYKEQHYLSQWAKTQEGHDYWYNILKVLYTKYDKTFTHYGWE